MSSDSVIGWREWVSLPCLGIEAVKAKVDTGARTSSLHAFDIEELEQKRGTRIMFSVYPYQRNAVSTVRVEADLLEYRLVTSSTGHRERRPVILTEVALLGQSWPIELTLANRDQMGFRMLLGREAVRDRFLVDPGKSYFNGRRKNKVPKRD